MILAIIILICLSAWFSGMEIALFSLSASKVKSLVLAQKKNSHLLQKLLKNKKRLLVTILLGNNLVNIAAASAATLWIQEKLGSATLGVAIGVMTLLILIFGEMYPKVYFQINAEKMALFFSPLVYILEIVTFPIIIILEKLLLLITKNKPEKIVSEKELKAFSRLAVEEGEIEFQEHEMIMNILKFNDKTAKEIMTPRYKMSIVNADTEIDQIAYFMAHEGLSRYPVFHNQEDNIIGYVHLIDIMKILNSDHRENTIEKYVQPILKVRAEQKIDTIFRKMQKEKNHIALVYREDQLLGIVTLEDILEEIVGEIEDEND